MLTKNPPSSGVLQPFSGLELAARMRWGGRSLLVDDTGDTEGLVLGAEGPWRVGRS